MGHITESSSQRIDYIGSLLQIFCDFSSQLKMVLQYSLTMLNNMNTPFHRHLINGMAAKPTFFHHFLVPACKKQLLTFYLGYSIPLCLQISLAQVVHMCNYLQRWVMPSRNTLQRYTSLISAATGSSPAATRGFLLPVEPPGGHSSSLLRFGFASIARPLDFPMR